MPYRLNSPEAIVGDICERAVDRHFQIHFGFRRLMVSMMGASAVWVDEYGNKHVAFDRLYFTPRMGPRWFDIKGKSGPVHHQITDSLRHGIDLPLWNAYCLMAKETGIGGSIALVEIKRLRGSDEIAPLLLWQRLSVLAKRLDAHSICNYPTDGLPYGAVFWPRAAFDVLGPLGIGNVPLPQTTRNLHPWEASDIAGRIRMPPDRPRQPDLFEESDWSIQGA